MPSPRIQLWSYNYAPEPTGIAPVSTLLAHRLKDHGWEVDVVAAHPHYPEPKWGTRRLPYRDEHDGIRLLRLPLWIGRDSAGERMRQEASFTASLMAALPVLGRPDVMLVASPSFPALAAAIANARLKGVPWVLWLHDLLPDGAVATGLLDEKSFVCRASRRLERSAYRSADKIAVLSASFQHNLLGKGVPPNKLKLIYDPATRPFPELEPGGRDGPPVALSMGNIGHTQGLAPLVAAFERSKAAAQADAQMRITGQGVAAPGVAAEIRSDRVKMLGLVDEEQLDRELRDATFGLVTQSYSGTEFNLPSKLMNFMAYGLPVIAAVNPAGEVARLVRESGSGWVVDSSDPDSLPRAIVEAGAAGDEPAKRGEAGRRFAEEHFAQDAFGQHFDQLLRPMIGTR